MSNAFAIEWQETGKPVVVGGYSALCGCLALARRQQVTQFGRRLASGM